MKAGRRDKAEEWYREFLKAGGDDMRVRLHLAGICERGGDIDEAIVHYEAAKKCFPTYVGGDSAWLQLYRIQKGEGNLREAIRELEGHVRKHNIDCEWSPRGHLTAVVESKRIKNLQATVRTLEASRAYFVNAF